MPTTFAAALRKGMATKVADSSDGLLLNFCPPEHARDVIHALGSVRKRPVIACYLKIFFSRIDAVATKMLIREFADYNRIPSYHGLFESVGVAADIESAIESLDWDNSPAPSQSLLRISLANPTNKDLNAYVSKFRRAGVDLPCIYPYFEPSEDEAFKIRKVEEIVRL